VYHISGSLARLASSKPSRFVEQHASLLDAGQPVLDAPCGFGRNSLFLAERGYHVIGVDNDHDRIKFLAACARSERRIQNTITLAVCNLDAENLPFAESSVGTLLIIHFIPEQWTGYRSVLSRNGYLLFETMGGQGANYLQLPHAGQMRALLDPGFRVIFYRERPVGPSEANAVAVRLIAQKI